MLALRSHKGQTLVPLAAVKSNVLLCHAAREGKGRRGGGIGRCDVAARCQGNRKAWQSGVRVSAHPHFLGWGRGTGGMNGKAVGGGSR